jgi:hypothetical protein
MKAIQKPQIMSTALVTKAKSQVSFISGETLGGRRTVMREIDAELSSEIRRVDAVILRNLKGIDTPRYALSTNLSCRWIWWFIQALRLISRYGCAWRLSHAASLSYV